MKKIGVTGSIASGKTTASKILSRKYGPLFSADEAIKKLYEKNHFKKLIIKKFKIKNGKNIKKHLRNKILLNQNYIKKLEKIIHPIVRSEMRKFVHKYRKKKFIFLEVPLLIESGLYKNYNFIFFIKAKKSLRLKRFISKGGNKKLFHILDKKQLSEQKKINLCDQVVVNERNVKILKKNLLDIFSRYV